MALKDVKERIKAQLDLVSGIGKTYTRLRLLDQEKDFEQLVAAGKLNAWMINRESVALRDEDVNQNLTEQRDVVVVHGWMSISDAADSQGAFDALVDAILSQLNTDRRPPSKLNATVETADPPFLRANDIRFYGVSKQVLCHYAEISMNVVRRYLQ